MTLDFNKCLKELDGKDAELPDGKKLTIGQRIIGTLLAVNVPNHPVSEDERYKFYKAIGKLNENAKEWTATEVAMLKSRFCQVEQNPWVYGQVCDFLDEKTTE
ncbi:hypothetical protein [Planctomicrobium piriforme]|uniref:Uncharacterized protein n=1 Tax=Planctomicrobium piriforme TaxID=1576369 RepID=A0A1I3ECJ7_9PLAN|nr:hypothetical protein [Planctomicrobium piriforme]SFH96638.1 hypothetical protein SAMN05421753_104163 [Planctomicrobium piriforme]